MWFFLIHGFICHLKKHLIFTFRLIVHNFSDLEIIDDLLKNDAAQLLLLFRCSGAPGILEICQNRTGFLNFSFQGSQNPERALRVLSLSVNRL